MKQFKKLVFCFLFVFLLISSVYSIDAITLNIGEQQNRKLYIYNPSSALTDQLELKLSSTGNANAWITTTQGNRMTVQVLPRENKSIPITVIATGCTENPCSGTVTFLANSTITGNSVSKEISISISSEERKGFIGTAPDLKWNYLVVIALLGALVSIYVLKTKK